MTANIKKQTYAAQLQIEGQCIADIANTADADRANDNNADSGQLAMYDVPVRACGDWKLEKLIKHCAAVWTFIGHCVSAGEQVDRDSLPRHSGTPAEWYRDAFGSMTTALEDRNPTEHIWTFDPAISSVDFWWRRTAQEAAIHRADAETALYEAGLGPTPRAIDSELAADGIDEIFDFFVKVRNPTIWAGNGETLHLHATDVNGEWLLTRTAVGVRMEHSHAKGDAAVRGPVSDLLLFAWGRDAAGELEKFGDEALIASWQSEVSF